MKKLYPFAGSQPGNLTSFAAKVLGAMTAIGLCVSSITAHAQALPTIRVHPKSHTAALGSGVIFRINATGVVTGYQWRKDGFSIAGATSPILVIPAVSRSNAGRYDVIVRNATGFVTSQGGVLTIVAGPGISTQPVGANFTSGTDRTLSVVATGDEPLTYQWTRGGAAIAGATNNTLVLNVATAADDGDYRVIVRNDVGSITSDIAALKAFTPPAITAQPRNQTNAAGQNVTFSVTATGTAPLSYQWRFNGNNVGGATGTSFQITGITYAQDGDVVSVVVSNAGGTVTSADAVLRVTTPVAPSFTDQPDSQTAAIGDRVTFQAAAAGTPTIAYQWTLNGSTTIPNTTNTTSSSLLVTNLTDPTHAGNYAVTITSPYGTATSTNAALTLRAGVAPTISGAGLALPADAVVNEGSTHTFTSQIDAGVYPAYYRWLKASRDTIAGQTNASLTISNISASSAGTYEVIITNYLGSVNSRVATLTVVLRPRITTHPASVTRASGSTHTFTVAHSGTGPFTYQWVINGVFDIDGATDNTLVLTNLTTGYNGDYSVRVSNAAGSTTSNPARLTVLTRPTITAFSPGDSVVNKGANLTFTSTATGTAVNYQWSFNGVPIPGATSSSLVLTNLTPANSGDYTLTAFNDADSATRTSRITVLEVPVITAQPQNQSVEASGDATFTVGVTGSPLAIQWLFNGTPLSGATNATLVLRGVTFAYSGATLAARISNILGTNLSNTITSSNAVLTVTAPQPPTITTQPADQKVAPGGTVTLSVVARGVGTLTYQWRLNGINLGGATSASLTLPNVTAAFAGGYSVRVSNAVGSVDSRVANVVVASTSIAGHWNFNAGNLAATIGTDLAFRGDTAAFTRFTNVVIAGQGKTVMEFPAATPSQGYTMTHGIAANGGGAKVNQYTLIMDVLYPVGTTGFRGLLQTDTTNAGDGDLFINGANGIGIGGQYHGNVTLGDWHRIAFAFDLTTATLWKYVDGVLVNQQALGSSGGVDNRWSLAPTALLFTDEDNETKLGYVSSIQIHGTRLTTTQIQALGGAGGNGIPTVTPAP